MFNYLESINETIAPTPVSVALSSSKKRNVSNSQSSFEGIASISGEDNISKSGPKSAVKNQKSPAIILRKLTADFPQLRRGKIPH